MDLVRVLILVQVQIFSHVLVLVSSVFQRSSEVTKLYEVFNVGWRLLLDRVETNNLRLQGCVSFFVVS